MCIILLKFLTVLYKITQLNSLFIEPKVATVLGYIPASAATVEFEGRQIKQC